MVFSSIPFLFYFLPAALLLYYQSRWRNLALLGVSLLFYSWGEFNNLWIIAFSILFNYTSGLLVATERRGRAKFFLWLSVVVNLGLLGWFKYSGFFAENINWLRSLAGLGPVHMAPVALPLGISFFTFHAMSYVFDVYWKRAEVERNLLNVAVYILMFPQLVAGPIIRFQTISHELRERDHTLDKFATGVKYLIIGLGQKVLIANSVAEPTDAIFALPHAQLSVGLAWLSAVCHTLQIYYDFAGYSNMAIGLGLMFGFHFPLNFDHPYISQSITEFWRRWHITLSSWFFENLYIPLGGSRKGRIRSNVNLMIVFFLCGLWHGASWKFVIWGLLQGLFLVIERMGLLKVLEGLPRVMRHFYVMFIVFVASVLFRVDTLEQGGSHLLAMIGVGAAADSPRHAAQYLQPAVALYIVAGVIGAMPFMPWLRRKWGADRPGLAPAARNASAGLAAAYMMVVLLFTVMSLAGKGYNPFIYFRF